MTVPVPLSCPALIQELPIQVRSLCIAALTNPDSFAGWPQKGCSGTQAFFIPFLSERIDHHVMLYAWRLLVDLADNLLFSIGLTLAVFAAIEFFTDRAKREVPATETSWDPLALPKAVEKSQQIKRGQYVFSIVWTILLIVLFNLYPEKIGYLAASAEGAVIVPLLAQAFFVHVPWISAAWIMLISLKLLALSDFVRSFHTNRAENAIEITKTEKTIRHAGVAYSSLLCLAVGFVTLDSLSKGGVHNMLIEFFYSSNDKPGTDTVSNEKSFL
jgi:hypothetical protein